MIWRLALFGAAFAVGCHDADVWKTGGTGGESHGVAVVCTDYISSSVTLLNGGGDAILAPTLIHSGSRPPSVHTALSGDIELPAEAPPDGSVTLIDREHAVLTSVDPVSGAVLWQLDVSTGFSANPHDVWFAEDGRVLVARHDPNPTPTRSDALDRGDDVLVLDADGRPAAALGFTGPDGFPGRPHRFLRVGELVWLTLNHISADYQEYRHGRIARLRVPTDAPVEVVDELRIDDVANCGGSASDGERVAIACGGAFDQAGDLYLTERSAVVLLDHEGNELHRLGAADPRTGRTFAPPVAFDAAGRVVAALFGDNEGSTDSVVTWDPTADEVEIVTSTRNPWVVWAFERADDGAVLAAEADTERPRLCRLGPQLVCMNPCPTGLPPRVLGRFGP